MSKRRKDTTITIDAADYLDLADFADPIEQADRREILRLLNLASEAARQYRGSSLALALSDCIARLEPLRRRIEIIF